MELERATLTRTLAKIMEAQGNLKDAARVLQEVQVETLGKMEKVDKIDYILEQIRLCLDSQDFLRANILSRKINTSVLQPSDCQELKLRYYALMNRYYAHIRDFLQLCRSYQHIYSTPIVQENAERRTEVLKMISLYAVLAPHGPEQFDIVQRVYEDKHLETLGPYKYAGARSSCSRGHVDIAVMTHALSLSLSSQSASQVLFDDGDYAMALDASTVSASVWNRAGLRRGPEALGGSALASDRARTLRLCLPLFSRSTRME